MDFIKKPWGYETVEHIHEMGLTFKTLHIESGQRLSLQSHAVKREALCIVGDGGVLLELQYGDTTRSEVMVPGDWYYIHPGVIHRLTNEGRKSVTIMEISTPMARDEDIVRLEDDYGRA